MIRVHSEKIIIFNGVSKHYRRKPVHRNSLKALFSKDAGSGASSLFTAVGDVNFAIPRGAAVALLGGNGAGKSTLLKLLTRVTLPDEGVIAVRGRLLCLLEVGAGFHHDLSGLENITLSGALLGLSAKEVGAAREDIIAFSGLASAIHEPVRTYSSGMLLRLAFSIGVYLQTDILAIDEALAVGDRAFQIRCLQKIRELSTQGRTLFLVSHDIGQLRAVCDTGLVMQEGRLVMQGDIESAIRFYEKQSGENKG